MKERPILFSGPMVRAILDGRKTQTRRVVKGTALRMLEDGFTAEYVADPGNAAWSPYGIAGDRLWVRETFRLRADQDVKPPSQDWWKAGAWYCADGGDEPSGCGGGAGKKRPAIHMPRWASRITLEITDLRVQRLQEISEEDAIAEGVDAWSDSANPARWKFISLWESINEKRGFGWETNPWVWALTLKRV